MNSLAEKYPQQIEKVLNKYPSDQRRSAVMPLLYLAQIETGFLTRKAMEEVAEIVGISTTDVASLVGFYTLYHEVPGGKYRMQVCTDLSCALRGAEEFLSHMCENLGIRVGETTPDGLITLEEVKCLAGCDKAPVFQIQSGDDISYHENQTVESALALVEKLRQQEQPAMIEETTNE